MKDAFLKTATIPLGFMTAILFTIALDGFHMRMFTIQIIVCIVFWVSMALLVKAIDKRKK